MQIIFYYSNETGIQGESAEFLLKSKGFLLSLFPIHFPTLAMSCSLGKNNKKRFVWVWIFGTFFLFFFWWINWNGLAFSYLQHSKFVRSIDSIWVKFFPLPILFSPSFHAVWCDQQLKIDKSESKRYSIRRLFFPLHIFPLFDWKSLFSLDSIEMENDSDKNAM